MDPLNDRSHAVTRFCLTMEEHRRTDAGRVRTSREMLDHFFPRPNGGTAQDRIFVHIPPSVRGPIVSGWGIRGAKSALRDTDEKIRRAVEDALGAGDIDEVVFEDGLAPPVLVDWTPLPGWWTFWRTGKLTGVAVQKALATARELGLFDDTWFLRNVEGRGGRMKGTDTVCDTLSKDQIVAWVRKLHESGDGSPAGLVRALGWETILGKTSQEALLFALDAFAKKVGLVPGLVAEPDDVDGVTEMPAKGGEEDDAIPLIPRSSGHAIVEENDDATHWPDVSSRNAPPPSEPPPSIQSIDDEPQKQPPPVPPAARASAARTRGPPRASTEVMALPGRTFRSETAIRKATPAPIDDDGPAASVPPASLVDPAPYVPRTRKWALIVVVVGSFIAAAAVAAPLWVAIIFGGVLAVSASRPYQLLRARLGNRSSLAAGLMTVGCGLGVAVAGGFLAVALTNELFKLLAHLDQQGSSGSLEGIIGARPTHALAELGLDTTRVYAWLQKEVAEAATYVASAAALVLQRTSSALLELIVALLTMYYLLVDGKKLVVRIEHLSPLDPVHTRALFCEARDVGRTAFIGTIATALVQGVIAGIGFVALGVPEPITWAAVTALASFLPVIGTLIVWVPMSGYLLMDGHPIRAVILAIYGIVMITSLADYVIRPRIVGRKGHGHPLLTLIALLGGIEVFGLAGLIIAPIVMSVFVAAFRLYERELRPQTKPAADTA